MDGQKKQQYQKHPSYNHARIKYYTDNPQISLFNNFGPEHQKVFRASFIASTRDKSPQRQKKQSSQDSPDINLTQGTQLKRTSYYHHQRTPPLYSSSPKKKQSSQGKGKQQQIIYVSHNPGSPKVSRKRKRVTSHPQVIQISDEQWHGPTKKKYGSSSSHPHG
jgi:hypothetical protein